MGSDIYTLTYDAEGHLVKVEKGVSPKTTLAEFTYDGDGTRVKSVMGSETILFVGGHYEVTNPGSGQSITKYYLAGATRIAMRTYTIPQSSTLTYLLGDHLGSTSLTTNASGTVEVETHYKPCPYGMLRDPSRVLREGEMRSTWTKTQTTTPDYRLSKFTFTGQYSYMDDPTTAGVEEGFKLMYYGARWYDPALSRFAQADSDVPASQGVQAYNVFSGSLPEDPSWVKNGYVNSDLLLGKLAEPVQAKYMAHEDYQPTEYWADAFANYVANNINLGRAEGMAMVTDVANALQPYIDP